MHKGINAIFTVELYTGAWYYVNNQNYLTNLTRIIQQEYRPSYDDDTELKLSAPFRVGLTFYCSGYLARSVKSVPAKWPFFQTKLHRNEKHSYAFNDLK